MMRYAGAHSGCARRATGMRTSWSFNRFNLDLLILYHSMPGLSLLTPSMPSFITPSMPGCVVLDLVVTPGLMPGVIMNAEID